MVIIKKFALFFILITLVIGCKKDSEKPSEMDLDLDSEIIEIPVDTVITEDLDVSEKKSIAEIKDSLRAEGFEFFDYVDKKTQDTILMQKYFMVFLKNGLIRSQNEEEAEILQKEHLAHLRNMYELGYADISGPFEDDGDIRGVTIYNVPTLKMADSLAKADPMVQAGRLTVEIHPWWAAKGFPLR